MKTLDITVWTLLVIGGLNWGLIGLSNFNLIAAIFGEMTALTRIIYTLIGIAAVYDIVAAKAIWRRWGLQYRHPVTA
ncbi:MAG: DUF378 domain-containing protein [Anaerohalosphaeraceae bacterium]